MYNAHCNIKMATRINAYDSDTHTHTHTLFHFRRLPHNSNFSAWKCAPISKAASEAERTKAAGPHAKMSTRLGGIHGACVGKSPAALSVRVTPVAFDAVHSYKSRRYDARSSGSFGRPR